MAEAARAGDEIAAAVWEEAARELAETARAAARAARLAADASRPAGAAAARRAAADASRPPGARSAPAIAISYSGGLFAAGDLLLAPLRAELAGLRPPLGTPLDGAARLLERPPLFQDLIFEAGAP